MSAEFESNNPFSSKLPDGSHEPNGACVENADDLLWSLLNRYADGEALPEEITHVEEMLSSDPALSRDLEFLRLTSESARSFVEIEPPASLRDSIFAATSHRLTLRQRAAARWELVAKMLTPNVARYAVPTGALAAAALAIVTLWPHHSATQLTGGSLQVMPPQSAAKEIATAKPSKAPYTTANNRKIAAKPDSVFTDNHKESDIVTPHFRAEGHSKGAIQVAANSPLQAHRVKHSAPFEAASQHKTQTAHLVQPAAPVDGPRTLLAKAVYSPQPMMDGRNQRLAWKDASDQQLASGDGPDGYGAVMPVLPESGSDTVASAKNDDTAAAPKTETPRTRVRIGHLLREQLPPDPRIVRGGESFKQMRSAEMQGYDRDTVQSIQRQQTTVAFIGRF